MLGTPPAFPSWLRLGQNHRPMGPCLPQLRPIGSITSVGTQPDDEMVSAIGHAGLLAPASSLILSESKQACLHLSCCLSPPPPPSLFLGGGLFLQFLIYPNLGHCLPNEPAAVQDSLSPTPVTLSTSLAGKHRQSLGPDSAGMQ